MSEEINREEYIITEHIIDGRLKEVLTHKKYPLCQWILSLKEYEE